MEFDQEQEYRRAMGAFATGVTVVSAARSDGSLSGMTVNSLTSVSLRPRLLLWCLGDQSERYDVFAGAEHWGVTVLGADDEALARRFARARCPAIGPPITPKPMNAVFAITCPQNLGRQHAHSGCGNR